MAKPIDLDDKRLHDEQGFIIYYILYKYIIHISQLKILTKAYQKMRSSVKQVKYDSHFIKGEKYVAKVARRLGNALTVGTSLR